MSSIKLALKSKASACLGCIAGCLCGTPLFVLCHFSARFCALTVLSAKRFLDRILAR